MSTRMLAVLVFAYLGSTVAISQQRAAVTIGETEYLISQRNADGRPLDYKYENALSAHSGRCVVVFTSVYLDDETAYIRFFGGWNQPDGPAQPISPDDVFGGDVLATAMTDATAVVMGRDLSTSSAIFFDSQGSPLTDTVAVAPYHDWTNCAAASPDSAHFALVVGGPDGMGDYGALFRLFSSVGEPQSNAISLYTLPGNAVNALGVSITDDGNAFATLGVPMNVVLVRVDSGFQASFFGPLEARRARHGYPGARDDGTLCVVYDLQSSASAYVRKYSFDGAALTDPIPLGIDIRGGAAFTPDGRFAVASDPDIDDHSQVQLFNADFTPVGPPVPFVIPQGIPPQRGYYEVRRPVAYEQDGTVWILWGGANGGPNHPDGETPMYLTQMKPFLRGDMNADGVVDNSDIDPFVLALLDPAAFNEQYPGLPYEFYGDMNRDGVMDNSDIDGFVARLLQ